VSSFWGSLHTLNAAVQKFDRKARTVNKVDDFAYLKDSTVLLVAKEVGEFDKNQKDILEECLNLRNKCGHPGKYAPRPFKVASFIEDLVTILFQ
jgi:hypothetical protein